MIWAIGSYLLLRLQHECHAVYGFGPKPYPVKLHDTEAHADEVVAVRERPVVAWSMRVDSVSLIEEGILLDNGVGARGT